MNEVQQPEIGRHDCRDHDGDGRQRPPEIAPDDEAFGCFDRGDSHPTPTLPVETTTHSTAAAAENPARILGAGHLSGQPFLVARAIDEPTDRQARGERDRRHPQGTGLSRWRGLRRRGIHDRNSPFRLQTDFDNMATRAMRLLELDQDGRPTWAASGPRHCSVEALLTWR